jgi:hypothetical protein
MNYYSILLRHPISAVALYRFILLKVSKAGLSLLNLRFKYHIRAFSSREKHCPPGAKSGDTPAPEVVY